jgi:membrane protease YdiL (CAAX protease family)
MSTSARAASKSSRPTPASWWEIFAVMALSLGTALLFPALKLVSVLFPVVYLLVERPLRRRSWSDIGFRFNGLLAGLVQNLGWILLVSVGTQVLASLGSYYLFPGYFQHVLARLPFEMKAISISIFIALAISTLGEEIIYRALFQNRMAVFLRPAAAIGITSLVFALMHFAPGPALIVTIDLAFVFVDSLIYGIIFHRSRNVFVAWIAHLLADITGVILLLMLK